MRGARAALAVALCVSAALAGCGSRVRVVDAATGEPVPAASVRVTDAAGSDRDHDTTGAGGHARVAVATAEGGMLWVSAPGYRTAGRRLDGHAGDPLVVSLQPAWIGAFIEPATSVHEPRKPCPTCPGRAR